VHKNVIMYSISVELKVTSRSITINYAINTMIVLKVLMPSFTFSATSSSTVPKLVLVMLPNLREMSRPSHVDTQ